MSKAWGVQVDKTTTLDELQRKLHELEGPFLEVWWAPGIQRYAAKLGGDLEDVADRLGVGTPDRTGHGVTVAEAINEALIKFHRTRMWPNLTTENA